MAKFLPDAIVPDGPYKGMIRVKPTVQVAVPGDTQGALTPPYQHMFAIGDSADAFGAVKSGRNSGFQAVVAAKNILKMIEHAESQEGGEPALDTYTPNPPGIHLSIGLTDWALDRAGRVTIKTGGEVNMNPPKVWRRYGVEYNDDPDV